MRLNQIRLISSRGQNNPAYTCHKSHEIYETPHFFSFSRRRDIISVKIATGLRCDGYLTSFFLPVESGIQGFTDETQGHDGAIADNAGRHIQLGFPAVD